MTFFKIRRECRSPGSTNWCGWPSTAKLKKRSGASASLRGFPGSLFRQAPSEATRATLTAGSRHLVLTASGDPGHLEAEKGISTRSEEHTSELQSRGHLVCRLLLEKKKEMEKAKGTIIS